MFESRVRHLEQIFVTLGYNMALDALMWMKQEMCAEKGFKRHNGTHYYYHLVDVTQDLFNHNIRDEITLTAALLHDAPEDIPEVTFKMLEDKYCPEVAKIVKLVTKLPDVDYKAGNNIKILYLDPMLDADEVRACLIKAADRKHNFGTLRDATPEKKMRQAKETRTYFFPFFKACRKKYPVYATYFFSVKTTIEPHLIEIEERYAKEMELMQYIQHLEEKNAALQQELDVYDNDRLSQL